MANPNGTTYPPAIQQVFDSLVIPRERLVKISEDIEAELTQGLKHGAQGSSIAMLPSYVPALPTGKETGKYVAIDLSGKNLRILLLTLQGEGKEPSVTVNNYLVSNAIMKGTGEQLFNFIVNCLQKFLREFELESANLPIGFVFSYPLRTAFDSFGSFALLLQEALELNMSTKAKINVVMNDTVGQLAAAAYKYGEDCVAAVVIAAILRTLRTQKKITKFDSKAAEYPQKKMVVVTEWEEFGNNGELNDVLTQFDREVDENSVHKGKQLVDKLTGALYLGELVRRILSQLILDRYVFNGTPVEKLDQTDTFPTKFISEILSEEEGSYKTCRRICDELDVPNHGSNDYEIIRQICHLVTQRSSAIVAAAISALLRHINRPNIKIGVGGALIQFHPTYHELLKSQLNQLAPLNVEWELVAADEGSAKGAALTAAVVEKLGL
ncbi:Phosphotransferase [Aphelenchoides besseyi]|nr:Phosphotransferase [Aphelenchoides besseyi]